MEQNTELRKLQLCLTDMLSIFHEICQKEGLTYFLFGGSLLGAIRHKGFIPWDNDIDVAMPREDFEKLKKFAQYKLPENLEMQTPETDSCCTSLVMRLRNMDTVCEIEGAMFAGSRFHGAFIDIFPLDNADKESSIKNNIQAWKVKQFYPAMAERAGGHTRGNSTIKQKIGNMLARLRKREKWILLREREAMKNQKRKAPYFVNLGSHYSYKKQVFQKDKLLPTQMAEFEGNLFSIPKDCDYVLKKFYGDNYMEIPKEKDRNLEEHRMGKLEIGGEK